MWVDGPVLQPPTDVCSQKALDIPCALAIRDKMLAKTDPSWQSLTLSCRLQGVRRVVGGCSGVDPGYTVGP